MKNIRFVPALLALGGSHGCGYCIAQQQSVTRTELQRHGMRGKTQGLSRPRHGRDLVAQKRNRHE